MNATMITGTTIQTKLLPYLLHTCDGCGTDHYQNEMFPVVEDINLCRVCSKALHDRIADKWTLGKIMRNEMTLEERNKLNMEQAKKYAWRTWK